MLSEERNGYWIDQYNNDDNWNTHYLTTGPEIWEQMEQKIDYFFLGVGTAGTIVGVSKYLKEKNPNVKIIGIDTVGSILATPTSMNTEEKLYKIEGIGQSCIPGILDRTNIDEWVKVDDPEAFNYARRLMKEESLLVGGSCGSAVAGMIKYLKEKNLDKKKDLRCCVLLPDGITNYMTKFLQDEWMIGNGFIKGDEAVKLVMGEEKMANPNSLLLINKTLEDYPIFTPLPYYDKRMTIADCFDTFKKGFSLIPIREKGEIIGVIEKTNLLKALLQKGVKKTNSCSHALSRDYFLVDIKTPLVVLERLLQVKSAVLVAKYNADKIEKLYCVTQNDLFEILEENLKEYL